jgi:sugar phosphate isomerase/epimerase
VQEPDAVPRLRIGIQLTSLRMPLRHAIETSARLGARGVEIDARHQLNPKELSQTGRRQLQKMLADLGLSVCAVGFRTRRGYDATDDLEQRVEATKAAMDFAYSMRAPVVVNQIGHIPEDEGPRRAAMLEVLADLGRHGQRAGALLAAETGSESGPRLAELIRALPPGSLAVDFNPGNLIVNGFSPLEAVRALGPHIMHVHAKDGVRDLARGRGLEVPLGRGTADFPALIGTLEEHGYRGYWTIEREQAGDPVQAIGLAVQFLTNL